MRPNLCQLKLVLCEVKTLLKELKINLKYFKAVIHFLSFLQGKGRERV